jgi:hypothetical protein
MNIIEEVKNIIKEEKNKQDLEETLWRGSLFQDMNDLKNDRVGRVGENLLKLLFNNDEELEFIYEGDSNTNKNDGTYDIKVGIKNSKLKRSEVKCARKGSNKTWQHENLRNTDECDFYIFIDFEPNHFYISFLRKNIDFDTFTKKGGSKHPIFKKCFSKRKGEVNYKFDFSETSIKNGIKHGDTLRVSETTNMEEIKNFIKKYF